MLKRLELSVLTAFIVSVVFSFASSGGELPNHDIRDKVIRLHIIANSDEGEDQELKLLVRDGVLEFMREIAKDVDKDTAAEAIDDHLPAIEELSRGIIEANGYSYNVTARRGERYFTARQYGDVTMGAGVYNALIVTLGDGGGSNWWCVAYPPLCVPPATVRSAERTDTPLGLSGIGELRDSRVKYVMRVGIRR